MKKLVLISLISLLFIGSQVNAEIIRDKRFFDPDTLEGLEEEFYNNGVITPTTYKEDEIEDVDDPQNYQTQVTDETFGGRYDTKLKGLPLFKKYRIKIENRFKIKQHEEEQKRIKAIQEEYYGKSEDDTGLSEEDLEELKNRSLNKVYVDDEGNEVKVSRFSRFKNIFKRKKKTKGNEIINSSNSKPDEETKSEENKPLAGGVAEVIAQKDMILDCDKLNYNEDNFDMEAIGNPVLSFPPQGVTIKANKIVYNTESNIIKAYDNVEIIKDGESIFGDYVMINMNDESAIVKKMRAGKMHMQINAKDVVASEDSIELTDGSLVGEGHYILNLKSGMAGSRLENFDIDEKDRSSYSKDGLEIAVKAKDIYVTAKKKHDIVTAKDIDIYYKGKHITRWASFTAHTNKNHEYFEANYPEFGSIPRMGLFAGPGFVFDVPNGATMKFIPFVNYKNKWGIGAALKYRSGTNYTEAFYGSSQNLFVLRGRQFFDDRFFMQYGINAYLDDWWMGTGMSKYQAELVYRDSYTIPNTLGRGRHAGYKQRITAGYIQDADFNRHNENLAAGTGTMRFKYMAELSQNLYNYSNKKAKIGANLLWVLQGSAAVYGTGDTQFIARTGPLLHTQVKRWVQDIGYFVSGKSDETPIPRADTYRYGRSNIYVREGIRFNKYITGNWFASAALSNDAPNDKLFQENGFYVSLGPDDLKFTLGYDFIRERTYFLFSTALDLKGTRVDYKKMVIKNPDRLGKDDSEKIEPVSFNTDKTARVKRTRAEVIEIEDPDREEL